MLGEVAQTSTTREVHATRREPNQMPNVAKEYWWVDIHQKDELPLINHTHLFLSLRMNKIGS
jgi:hypothetical protein